MSSLKKNPPGDVWQAKSPVTGCTYQTQRARQRLSVREGEAEGETEGAAEKDPRDPGPIPQLSTDRRKDTGTCSFHSSRDRRGPRGWHTQVSALYLFHMSSCVCCEGPCGHLHKAEEVTGRQCRTLLVSYLHKGDNGGASVKPPGSRSK